MAKADDLRTRIYGRLTVTDRAENTLAGQTRWNCLCNCGNTPTVNGADLKRGRSRSCGCLQVEITVNRLTTHGYKHSRLYRIWQAMKTRCSRPSYSCYHRYGGRGICVCEEWKRSFVAFKDWALANGYSDNLSIDRINNNGNYEPANCRWATLVEQARNKG